MFNKFLVLFLVFLSTTAQAAYLGGLSTGAHTLLIGPTSGGAAAATFRTLVASDLPAGTGTVTSISVTTANGVSGSVATATTTPAITLTLGAITPSSVAATGTVGGSNLSGTNTGDITLTAVGAAPSANAATLSGQALTLQPFDSTHPGVVAASGGGTTNFLRADGTFAAPPAGTVTTLSVVTANGFAGTVATATTTPAITLTTSITGVLKGNGTAISAAAAGTDYQAPISTSSAPSNQFATGFTAPNTFTYAQPSFSNISGTATVAQTTIAASAIGASAIDWSLSNSFTKTLGANTTFTFSNQTSGQTIVVRLTNTASNYTVTWPGGVLWSGGSAPTQTIGAKSDVYTFFYDGSTTYGSVVQNF